MKQLYVTGVIIVANALASSSFNLGACYLEGTGVRKDVDEAMKWFMKAALLGHERSAKILESLQRDSAL